MSNLAMSNLAGRRSYRARSELERKLRLLEDWAINGVPAGYIAPKSIAQFIKWGNAGLGIQGQTKLDLLSSHGKYSDLRLRLDRVLAQLHPKTSAEPQAETNKDGERALRRQNVELHQDNRLLLQDLSTAKARISELEDINRQQAQEILSLKKRTAKNVILLKNPK
jgi:hypothetical protein